MASASHDKFVADLNAAVAKVPLMSNYIKPATVETVVTSMETAVADAADKKVRPILLKTIIICGIIAIIPLVMAKRAKRQERQLVRQPA